MQIANKLNWPERSVSYLCRSYDQLNHGQKYSEIKPVIHIGFLDYTLFVDCPEFYATYKLINVKSGHVYSDKLTLSVIDLTCIHLVTEEDRLYHLDCWTSLFKATTWEEIKMLAQKDSYIHEASDTMFRLSADEEIQKRCRDREEYYLDILNYQHVIAQKEEALSQKDEALSKKDKALSQKDDIIANQANEIMYLKSQLKQYKNG